MPSVKTSLWHLDCIHSVPRSPEGGSPCCASCSGAQVSTSYRSHPIPHLGNSRISRHHAAYQLSGAHQLCLLSKRVVRAPPRVPYIESCNPFIDDHIGIICLQPWARQSWRTKRRSIAWGSTPSMSSSSLRALPTKRCVLISFAFPAT